MLNEWEMRRWVDIERELTADGGFEREVRQLSEREHRGLTFWRRFYPGGYLGGAVTYMLTAMGGGPRVLGGLVLFGLVAWFVVELWAARVDKPRARARPRLGAR